MNLQKYLESSYKDACVWSDIFIDDERNALQKGFLLTGFLSIVFSGWLNVSLLFTNLRSDSSYRNLANFTLISFIRQVVPILLHTSIANYVESLYGSQMLTCRAFAFFETFLAVFEVECLTHVCIERYVLAKYEYITNGWQIRKIHYNLYLYLCLLFACLYSIPPLFDVGRYSFDFQCMSCTFDLILPDSWVRYIVVTIFVLRSIKPAAVITMMLIWARDLERNFHCSVEQHRQFTRSVICIAVVNLCCWSPIAVIRGSIIISQLMYLNWIPTLPGCYVMWAMWIHWVAPAITAIALCLVDDRVRHNMFKIWASQYEIRNNENKKK